MMLQNIHNHGMYVNGLSGVVSNGTQVAGWDLDVRVRRDVAGKPLSPHRVPGAGRSCRLSSHAFAIEGSSTEPRMPAEAPVTSRPKTVLEPPAAAWASLVILTAISL
jgi:hypothetical protein